ncbi:MAG: rod shape-determining protein MreC [Bacteroidales bacterium]|nr:rod shape-determining protein MreC [Bacteroidales bacterium]
METLIRFFYKYSYTLLFILLEFIAFNLIIANNDIKKQRFATSANSFTAFFQKKVNTISDYLNLKEQNDILFQQLSLQNANSAKLYKINTTKFKILQDSSKVLMYEYIQAEVIKNSVNLKYNHFTLDAGTKQGIEVGMAVIAPSGIAGIIRETSPNFSVAISLLNIDLGISAKLKNHHYFGSINWNGRSDYKLTLDFIPNRLSITEGDSIVTSGYSFIFPKNITIGTVSKIEKDMSTSFYKLQIQPSVSFSSLNKVWIIKNLLNEELKKLNESTR